jgi:hypothetical protein
MQDTLLSDSNPDSQDVLNPNSILTSPNVIPFRQQNPLNNFNNGILAAQNRGGTSSIYRNNSFPSNLSLSIQGNDNKGCSCASKDASSAPMIASSLSSQVSKLRRMTNKMQNIAGTPRPITTPLFYQFGFTIIKVFNGINPDVILPNPCFPPGIIPCPGDGGGGAVGSGGAGSGNPNAGSGGNGLPPNPFAGTGSDPYSGWGSGGHVDIGDWLGHGGGGGGSNDGGVDPDLLKKQKQIEDDAIKIWQDATKFIFGKYTGELFEGSGAEVELEKEDSKIDSMTDNRLIIGLLSALLTGIPLTVLGAGIAGVLTMIGLNLFNGLYVANLIPQIMSLIRDVEHTLVDIVRQQARMQMGQEFYNNNNCALHLSSPPCLHALEDIADSQIKLDADKAHLNSIIQKLVNFAIK